MLQWSSPREKNITAIGTSRNPKLYPYLLTDTGISIDYVLSITSMVFR